MESGGLPVACDGRGEDKAAFKGSSSAWQECFDNCRSGAGDEKECIERQKCVETAESEYKIAATCEKQMACKDKGYLGGQAAGERVRHAVRHRPWIRGDVCHRLRAASGLYDLHRPLSGGLPMGFQGHGEDDRLWRLRQGGASHRCLELP